MKLSTPIIIVCAVILAVGIANCGSNSETSECSCEICINDVPAYPSDSEASCTEFMNEQDCSSSSFTTDSSQTCGGEDQPVCTVSGCSGQCQCPGEPTADLAADYDGYEEVEEE
jgi:hypothetical protein